MSYTQITSQERYMIATLRWQGNSPAEIGRQLDRHRSTITREIARNQCGDGAYRAEKADSRTRTRRRAARKVWQFSMADLNHVSALLRRDWSPEQVAGRLRRRRRLKISHETIYRFVRRDRVEGGTLHTHLRHFAKRCRKRYRGADSRGVLPGTRHISERPKGAENRTRFGHWEIDTVIGAGDRHCIVTMVERKSGYALIGKLKARTTAELNRRVIKMIKREASRVRTITADNGTEFHAYVSIEKVTDAMFYFANPYHSWERGTNENTNGLIRQYLPKRTSMASVTQRDCDAIARKINTRPRKRLGYQTPEECYVQL